MGSSWQGHFPNPDMLAAFRRMRQFQLPTQHPRSTAILSSIRKQQEIRLG
jgi:hypothetical protein